MKEKQPSLDVIRAVSTVAIVLFHYSFTFVEYNITGSHISFLKFASGDWGGVFVAVFFMLSGAALYYNWDTRMKTFSGKHGILDFYWKRWLAIFPMFYIAWTVMYIINSRRLGTWYWGGRRRNFLLTVFGMDGYFMHHGQNYYCLGEWFLGGIILIYLLYPLLQLLFNKLRWPSTVMLTAIFVFNLYRNAFSNVPTTNIFIWAVKYYNSHIIIPDSKCLWTCIMDFWVGMLLITYRKKIINKWSAAVSAAVFILLLFVQVPVSEIIVSAADGAAVYIMLSWITGMAAGHTAPAFAKVIKFISRYSYGIFLVHHVILYGVMPNFKNSAMGLLISIVLFIAVFALISGVSVLLTEPVKRVIKAAGFRVFSRGKERNI